MYLLVYYLLLLLLLLLVPELQGEPDDIARDKCQMAVDRVAKLAMIIYAIYIIILCRYVLQS